MLSAMVEVADALVTDPKKAPQFFFALIWNQRNEGIPV